MAPLLLAANPAFSCEGEHCSDRVATTSQPFTLQLGTRFGIGGVGVFGDGGSSGPVQLLEPLYANGVFWLLHGRLGLGGELGALLLTDKPPNTWLASGNLVVRWVPAPQSAVQPFLTFSGGYLLGLTQETEGSYGADEWLPAAGPQLSLDIGIRIPGLRPGGVAMALGVHVGEVTSDEMNDTQYHKGYVWIVGIFSLSVPLGVSAEDPAP
jgi:hypothetical protein